jgi:hypothetical protein
MLDTSVVRAVQASRSAGQIRGGTVANDLAKRGMMLVSIPMFTVGTMRHGHGKTNSVDTPLFVFDGSVLHACTRCVG